MPARRLDALSIVILKQRGAEEEALTRLQGLLDFVVAEGAVGILLEEGRSLEGLLNIAQRRNRELVLSGAQREVINTGVILSPNVRFYPVSLDRFIREILDHHLAPLAVAALDVGASSEEVLSCTHLTEPGALSAVVVTWADQQYQAGAISAKRCSQITWLVRGGGYA